MVFFECKDRILRDDSTDLSLSASRHKTENNILKWRESTKREPLLSKNMTNKTNGSATKEATKQRRLKKVPKIHFNEYFENTTLHGLYDVYRARNCGLRSFWLLIFVAGLFMAVYGCYAILAEFLARPVVVSYFVTRNDTLTLPDILVCPINRFNRSYFDMHNVSKDLGQHLEMGFFSAFGMKDLNPPTKEWFYKMFKESDKLEEELERMLEDLNVTFTQFFNDASLDCAAIIDLPTAKPSLDCHNFETVMTSVGKCYRIPGKQQQASGYGYGLLIIITLPHNEFHPGLNNLPSDGIVVKLAETDKGLDYDLSFVPTGVHAIMPLKATRYEFINDPPRYECTPDYEVNSTYSRMGCFDTCITAKAEDACHCSPAATPKATKPICKPTQLFSCFYPQMTPTLNGSDGILHYCRNKCKPTCSYWQYQTTMTYALFPSPESKYFIQNDTEYNYLREHKILLEVFYEHLEYTLIKHIPAMTIDSFVAQLGGQVSLWVGGSILTVIQLLVFLIQVLYNRCVEVPAAALRNRRSMVASNIVSHTAFLGLGKEITGDPDGEEDSKASPTNNPKRSEDEVHGSKRGSNFQPRLRRRSSSPLTALKKRVDSNNTNMDNGYINQEDRSSFSAGSEGPPTQISMSPISSSTREALV